MGKSTELRVSICSSKTRNILVGIVDDMNIAGRKQNMSPMCHKVMKLINLGEPTSFLDYIYIWDAPNVNANRTKL